MFYGRSGGGRVPFRARSLLPGDRMISIFNILKSWIDIKVRFVFPQKSPDGIHLMRHACLEKSHIRGRPGKCRFARLTRTVAEDVALRYSFNQFIASSNLRNT